MKRLVKRLVVVPGAVLALLLSCGVIEATTTLTVTQGSLSNILLTGDAFFSFAGDGFSGSAVRVGGQPQAFDAFTTGVTGLGLSEFSAVMVGGSSCLANTPLSSPCGAFAFHSRPLAAAPPGWPFDVPFTDSAPFTAAGHLNVGTGFDVQGWGTVEGTFCPLCTSIVNSTNVRYTFSVDEPSTFVVLLAGGLAASAALVRKRRRYE